MNIWEQKKDETAKAYEAARLYFEMGAERSLESVSKKLGKSRTICDRWSRKHSWVNRAKAYDEHLTSIEYRAIDKAAAKNAVNWENEKQRIRMEALENSRLLIEKAKQMLQFPLAKTTIRDGQTTVNPANWGFRDAAKFFELADKLQRLAAEMATENVSITDERERYEQVLQSHMKKYGLSRADAVADLIAVKPESEAYVN